VTPSELSARIKTFAEGLGFDLCRIAKPGTPAHLEFFRRWLDRGNAAGMQYMHRFGDRRADPAALVPASVRERPRSIVVLGVDYFQFALDAAVRDDPSRGIIASYAWGQDYHDIIRPLLFELDAFIRSLSGRREQAKCLVDTGPVLERDWAMMSGAGFSGKNCCTIHPQRGSWLFLATIVVPEDLAPDAIDGSVDWDAGEILAGADRRAHFGFWELHAIDGDRRVTGTCGQCTRCMDVCPTDAFAGPFHLDARRCIAYWTIETQDAIPIALRRGFGNRIFGCDICQEVCPWNTDQPRRFPRLAALRAVPDRVAPRLLDGFDPSHPYWLDDEAFRRQFSGSPVLRAKRVGMLRNISVALGNWGAAAAVDGLRLAAGDASPVVRAHAAWGLSQVRARTRSAEAARILSGLRTADPSDLVRAEAALL
jgi:epoxyqueuosine reductase